MRIYYVCLALIACYQNQIYSASPAERLHTYVWALFSSYGAKQNADSLLNSLITQGGSPYRLKAYIINLDSKDNPQEIIKLMHMPVTVDKKKMTVLELYRNDPEMQLIYAKAYYKSGDHKKAEELFVTLSKQFPQHPETTLFAAETLLRQRNTTQALATLNAFLNANPHKPTHYLFYFLKSQALHQERDIKGALKFAKKSLKLHPGFAQAWLLRAMLEEQLGMINDALNSYQRFLTESGLSNAELMKKLFELKKKVSMKEAARERFIDHVIAAVRQTSAPHMQELLQYHVRIATGQNLLSLIHEY